MLPKSKFREGYELSKANAIRIIDEAKYNFEKGFFATACYLGFLGIEEIGKAMLFLKYWDMDGISRDLWENEFKDHITKLHFVIRIIVRYIKDIWKRMPRIKPDKTSDVSENMFDRGIGKMHQLAKMWSVFVDFNFYSGKYIYPKDDYISYRIESYANMLFDTGAGYTEMALNALEFFERDTLQCLLR